MTTKLLALAGIFTTIFAFGTPAVADAPSEVTEVQVFEEPDPCNPDGPMMTTTLTFHVKEHSHKNNNVFVADFTATTDNGYEGSGHYTAVEAANHFSFTQNAMVTNADGDRYKVSVHINGTPNGIAVDRFSIRCIGGH
jgi:hypothetical protein